MIIAVPEFGGDPAVKDKILQSRAESGAEKVLLSLQSTPLSKSEIAQKLELNTVTGALNRTIKELLNNDLIEYTIPDKPNSRLQKYRLTEKARSTIDTGAE